MNVITLLYLCSTALRLSVLYGSVKISVFNEARAKPNSFYYLHVTKMVKQSQNPLFIHIPIHHSMLRLYNIRYYYR